MEKERNRQLGKAFIYYQQNRYKECIEELEKHLVNDLDDTYILHLLLVCKINLGASSKELSKIAHQLLRNNAEDDLAFFALGIVSEKNNQLEKAKAYFENALKQKPEEIDYLLRLSRLLWRMDRYHKSMEIIDYAISLAPNDPKVLAHKSELESQNLNFKKARITLDAALKEDPNNVGLHLLSGYVAMANMNVALGQMHFQEALRANPFDVEIKVAYLNSKLAEFWIFRILLSKFWVFHGLNLSVRPMTLIFFLLVVLIFRTKVPNASILYKFGYWYSIALLVINLLYWWIMPALRTLLGYKIWKTLYFDFWSYRNFVYVSCQLGLLAILYYFITNDFRGVTSACTLLIYCFLSIIIPSQENPKKQKIIFSVFALIYLLAGVNLILDIMGIVINPMQAFVALAWMLILFLFPQSKLQK